MVVVVFLYFRTDQTLRVVPQRSTVPPDLQEWLARLVLELERVSSSKRSEPDPAVWEELRALGDAPTGQRLRRYLAVQGASVAEPYDIGFLRVDVVNWTSHDIEGPQLVIEPVHNLWSVVLKNGATRKEVREWEKSLEVDVDPIEARLTLPKLPRITAGSVLHVHVYGGKRIEYALPTGGPMTLWLTRQIDFLPVLVHHPYLAWAVGVCILGAPMVVLWRRRPRTPAQGARVSKEEGVSRD